MIENSALAYMPVPVPLLPEMYRVLAELTAGVVDEPEPGGGSPLPGGTLAGDLGENGVGWDAADLARLAATDMATTRLISRMLDVLAETPDQRYTTSDLVERLDVSKANLRGSLAALTRHIKRHYAGLGWPMIFEWGGDVGEGAPMETHYKVTPELAAIWRQVRGR